MASSIITPHFIHQKDKEYYEQLIADAESIAILEYRNWLRSDIDDLIETVELKYSRLSTSFGCESTDNKGLIRYLESAHITQLDTVVVWVQKSDRGTGIIPNGTGRKFNEAASQKVKLKMAAFILLGLKMRKLNEMHPTPNEAEFAPLDTTNTTSLTEPSTAEIMMRIWKPNYHTSVEYVLKRIESGGATKDGKLILNKRTSPYGSGLKFLARLAFVLSDCFTEKNARIIGKTFTMAFNQSAPARKKPQENFKEFDRSNFKNPPKEEKSRLDAIKRVLLGIEQ